MKLHIDKEVSIDAPAEKVWEVLGDNYENVGRWATVIPESAPRNNQEGELQGRTCYTAYGDTKEMITNWDEQNMTYSYQADGLPAIFKSGGSTWAIRPVGGHRSHVTMKLRMEFAPLPGLLMGWLMKPRMDKDMDGLMDDLKHYVEKGTPHPKKLKSLEK